MRLTVLALATCLLVAGCSGEEERRALPVPSLSPTPSATATAASLPSPKETGVAGEVERAVLEYYAAMNGSAAAGSTAAYRAAFTAACTTCTRYADTLDTYFTKGQRFRGAATQVLSLAVVPSASAGTGGVDLRLRVSDYELLGPDGAVLEEFDGSEGAVTVFVSRQPNGRWLVSSVVDRSGQ